MVSPATRRRRRRRWIPALVVLSMLGLAAIVVTRSRQGPAAPSGPPCQATASGQTYGLELDQASNATTIAAVAKREGLPDHAVTVALATAIQESRLRNLSYGDRDSLGLFQQRPSQGWGTAEQVMSPSFAAAAFYRKLTAVSGWQTMSVTEAAQQVQHSAAPSAYAQWEPQARVLAQTLTGEVPAGFSCRVNVAKGATPDPGLADAMRAELGPSASVASPTPSEGWTTASWLVAHADEHQLAAVTFAGQRWTASSGSWKPLTTDAPSDPGVRIG
jgi:hypothetical protein